MLMPEGGILFAMSSDLLSTTGLEATRLKSVKWFSHFVLRLHQYVDQYSGYITNSKCQNTPYPANTKRWTTVSLLLAHRLRRWANIKPTLVHSLCWYYLTIDWYPKEAISLMEDVHYHHCRMKSQDMRWLQSMRGHDSWRLTFIALKYLSINHGTQRFFSIWNRYKSLS